MDTKNPITKPRPGTRAANRRIPNPAKKAPSRPPVPLRCTMSRPKIRALATYPSGPSTASAPSTATPSGMPTTLAMTTMPKTGRTTPSNSPRKNDAQKRRPAITTASAARGNSHTNSTPRIKIDRVTATHSTARITTTNPANRLSTSSFSTWPWTVPRVAVGAVREATSPPTRAPGRTVALPLRTVTLPPTRPLMKASPSSTSASPVTRPSTTRSPRPT